MFFFFKKFVSEKKFKACAVSILKKHAVQKEGLDYLKSIESISLPDAKEEEKALAKLYLQLESFLSKEQAKKRISSEVLRAQINKKCHADKVQGNFSLIFLPVSKIEIKLFEMFSSLCFDKARFQLADPEYKKLFGNLKAIDDFNGIIKDNKILWSDLQKKFYKHPLEKQNSQIKSVLKKVLNLLKTVLSETFGSLRAERLFEESYKELKNELDFIDDFSKVLEIVPEEFLSSERIELMPKTKLEEEVRRGTRELELALSNLSEEKIKLARALEELKALEGAEKDFISVISHQFRTPLSGIRWSAEVLETELLKLLPEEQRKDPLEFVRSIYEKSRFLVNVLSDIFAVLAVENETMKIEKKPVELWEIIDDLVKDFQKEAESRKIKLIFSSSAVPIKEVFLDQEKIKHAFEILIRNAVNYTPENGEIKIAIQESEYLGKPALAVIVKDSGIGIAKEDFPRLFTKFFRAKNAIKTVPDGAGLGLYLAKNFIEAHNGRLNAESELGKGSVFTVFLQFIAN
ncbi:MAG: hypothetical protein HYV52_01595 [Parcubacteria group bacterium]|nr:hypothetical protein [Parcubacteria group bacterium]